MLLKTKKAIKWIDALLDPKWKKGVGQLQTSEGKYCCLGVGCKVTRTPFTKGIDTYSNEFGKKVGLSDSSGEFGKKVGLFNASGEFDKTIYGHNSLASLNDGRYKNSSNFLMIRKHILANLKHIFEPEIAKELKTYYGK